jgi:hypothetical protein
LKEGYTQFNPEFLTTTELEDILKQCVLEGLIK